MLLRKTFPLKALTYLFLVLGCCISTFGNPNQGPKLYLATGAPVDGTLQSIKDETVTLRASDGGPLTYQLDEFTRTSKTDILVWAFDRLSTVNGLFEIKTDRRIEIGIMDKQYAIYDCTILNNSPITLPKGTTIAYNSHLIEFVPEKSGTNSGRFHYVPVVRTKGYLSKFNKLAPEGLYDFKTHQLDETSQYDQRYLDRYNDDELNPDINWLLGETFRPKRANGNYKPPQVHRVVFEIRIQYEGETLYQHLTKPALRGILSTKWQQPNIYEPKGSSFRRAVSEKADSKHEEVETEVAVEEAPVVESSRKDIPEIPYQSIAIINTDDGTGTGFLIRTKNRTFMATNIHVVAGAREITCTTADGSKIPVPNNFFIAKDRDLAIFPIDFDGQYLELVDNLAKTVRIGDKLTVFGNEAGASVITECTGVVKGVGPSRIETDAKFVEGNSGSPALHHASGKVIGIAAYYIEYDVPKADKTDSDDESSRTSRSSNKQDSKDDDSDTIRRRFAERLDNVEEWEQGSFAKLGSESDALDEYTEYIDAVVEIALVIINDQRFISADSASSLVRRPLQEFHARYDGTRSYGSDGNRRAITELQKDLSAHMDVYYKGAEKHIRSSYFKQELERAHAYATAVEKFMNRL